MDAFIGGICGLKLTVIKATYRMQIFDLSAVTQFILLFRKQYWKSKIMAMNNKGTNAYTAIRNFRRVKKNAYTCIACVHFASALFAYLRAALYMYLSPIVAIPLLVYRFFYVGHRWYGELTPVKTRCLLTSIT